MKLEVVKYEQPNIEAKEEGNKALTIGVSVVCGVLALCTITAVAVHLRRRNESISEKQNPHQSYIGQNLKSSPPSWTSASQSIQAVPAFNNYAFDYPQTKKSDTESKHINYFYVDRKRYTYPEEPPPDYPMD
ncbi:unnamed protein product [Lymnaea stagnalis]|uniref:Uncharacterized protein n=1 Tax=Lymnaea stagnalis TaxID=6523 RepID=A0AAV2IK34_LYMST